LADPLRGLDAGLSAALLQDIEDDSEADVSAEHDRQMLYSFARGERGYEDALGPLVRLLKKTDKPCVNTDDCKILSAKVLQQQSWAAVASGFNLAGKADVLACLRAELSKLLVRV
jgi:hypothetical protein